VCIARAVYYTMHLSPFIHVNIMPKTPNEYELEVYNGCLLGEL